jgi:hypothetical protein
MKPVHILHGVEAVLTPEQAADFSQRVAEQRNKNARLRRWISLPSLSTEVEITGSQDLCFTKALGRGPYAHVTVRIPIWLSDLILRLRGWR